MWRADLGLNICQMDVTLENDFKKLQLDYEKKVHIIYLVDDFNAGILKLKLNLKCMK